MKNTLMLADWSPIMKRPFKELLQKSKLTLFEGLDLIAVCMKHCLSKNVLMCIFSVHQKSNRIIDIFIIEIPTLFFGKGLEKLLKKESRYEEIKRKKSA